jgi:anti-anti-sigma factor
MSEVAMTTGSAVSPGAPTGHADAHPAPALRFAVSRALGTVVVTAHGDLAGPGGHGLAAVLGDLVDGQGNLSLVVDLGDVGRIDDDAAGILAAAAGRVHRRGGTFRLHRPCPAVAGVLRRTGTSAFSSPVELAPESQPESPHQRR